MHHLISFILRVAYAVAFGFILLLHTEDIINYIPQLLGGLIMLEAIAQMLELFMLKLKTQVPVGYFITPIAVVAYGLFLIFFCTTKVDTNASVREVFNPTAGISWLTLEMQLAGLCCIAFFISEIVISIKFFKPLYQPEKFKEEQKRIAEYERMKEEEAKKAAQENEKEAATPSEEGLCDKKGR